MSTEEQKHTENDPEYAMLWAGVVYLWSRVLWIWTRLINKMLASRLAIISGKPKSVVLSELYSRLNLHLVRANATAILSRWLPS